MTIQIEQQLGLLHDILDEHQSDSQATASEYQQIRRLVKSMLSNQQLTDMQIADALPQIYDYCLQGENAKNQQSHIAANKESISRWLDDIKQSNPTIY